MTEINQNSHLVAQSDNSSSYDESSVYAESQDAEVPNENNSVTSDDVVAKHETAAVTRLKLAVLLVLVGSTLAIALSVFFYLSNIEESQFNKQFRDDSHKVMESIGSTLDKTLASYDGLAMTLISHAEATNQSWPFVTLPDFAARLSKVLPLSDAVNINVVPLVTQQQRTKWEQYSVEHDYWVNENMHFQKNWDRYYGPVVFDGEPNTVLMGDFGEIPRNER